MRWWEEREAARVVLDYGRREVRAALRDYKAAGARKQIAARLDIHEGTVDNIVAKYRRAP